MKARHVLVIGAALGSLVLAGCQRTAQQPAPMAEQEQKQMLVVNIVAKEFAFEPKELRVKPGMVRFEVKNEGAVEHEFMIEGVTQHGEHASETFQPGVTHTVEVELKPGTYTVACNVPGHREAGMMSTLIVQ